MGKESDHQFLVAGGGRLLDGADQALDDLCWGELGAPSTLTRGSPQEAGLGLTEYEEGSCQSGQAVVEFVVLAGDELQELRTGGTKRGLHALHFRMKLDQFARQVKLMPPEVNADAFPFALGNDLIEPLTLEFPVALAAIFIDRVELGPRPV